jgi:hypothetical protein
MNDEWEEGRVFSFQCSVFSGQMRKGTMRDRAVWLPSNLSYGGPASLLLFWAVGTAGSAVRILSCAEGSGPVAAATGPTNLEVDKSTSLIMPQLLPAHTRRKPIGRMPMPRPCHTDWGCGRSARVVSRKTTGTRAQAGRLPVPPGLRAPLDSSAGTPTLHNVAAPSRRRNAGGSAPGKPAALQKSETN